METAEGNRHPVLYKMDIENIRRRRMLSVPVDDFMFHRPESRCRNGQRAACHPGYPKWFEMIEPGTEQWVILSGSPATQNVMTR